MISLKETDNAGLNIYKPFPISSVHTLPDQSTGEVKQGL